MNFYKLSHQYDQIAKTFASVIETQQEESRQAMRQLTPDLTGTKILDLGCGEGSDCSFYQSKGAAYVAGMDASEELLTKARASYENVDFCFGLFDQIPFDNQSFDHIFFKYALQTASDLEPIFKEVYRVLNPGGTFTLLVTHPIRQFYEKKKEGKNYFDKEIVDSICFGGALTFQEPSHTLAEYFSEFMLEKFVLLHYDERFDSAAEKIIDLYPGFLVLQWEKK